MKDRKWTLENMHNFVKINHPNKTLVDVFVKELPYQKQKWVTLKCNNESHSSYSVWWNNFIRDNNWGDCPECVESNTGRINWTNEKIVDFYNEFGLSVLDIDEWVDIDTPMGTVDERGFKYYKSITNIRQSHSKGNDVLKFMFSPSNPYSIDNLKRYCELYANEYEPNITEYGGVKSECQFIYIGKFMPDIESKIFLTTIDGFVNGGVRHPFFSSSKGELYFERLLIDNNIKYKKQKTFDECRYKGKLRFDFLIIDTNELVEIDGDQHRISVDWWGGVEAYNTTVEKDRIKTQFCIDNSIKLTRIDYSYSNLSKFENDCNNFISNLIKCSHN